MHRLVSIESIGYVLRLAKLLLTHRAVTANNLPLNNRETLLSVLEPFLQDPTVGWDRSGRAQRGNEVPLLLPLLPLILLSQLACSNSSSTTTVYVMLHRKTRQRARCFKNQIVLMVNRQQAHSTISTCQLGWPVRQLDGVLHSVRGV